MGELDKIKYQFKSIELLESSVNLRNNDLQGELELRFELNLENQIILKDDLISVIAKVAIFDTQGKYKYGAISTSCTFEIQHLNNYFKEDSKHFGLPKELIYELNSIATSTTRGIMYSIFRGTGLNNAILPIIDSKKLIEIR